MFRDIIGDPIALLLGVVENVAEAVTVQNLSGQLVYANTLAARVFGYPDGAAMVAASRDEILAGYDINDEAGHAFPLDQFPGRKVLAGGDGNEVILRFRMRATGEERIRAVRAKPIVGADGKLQFAVNLFRDVTDTRKQLMRQSFIAAASTLLASSIDYETTLRTVARSAVPEVADWAAVDLLEDGVVKRLAVAHIDPAKEALVDEITRRYPPKPGVESGIQRILRTGVGELISQIPRAVLEAAAEDAEHLRLIDQLQLHSYIAVPLFIASKAVGVVTFAMAESKRSYSQEDFAIAQTLADRASIALEHAHLFRELDRARAAAVEANRAKDDFLAMLGHELRNPLAPILTALELMQLRAKDTLTNERAIIERQVRHLVRLVDDLLDVSRIARGRVSLTKTNIDLREIIGQAVEMSAPLLDEHKQELSVYVPPDAWVEADPVRLAQVFANVLNNASKYSKVGGKITVTATRKDADFVISIVDTGAGISPQMLPRVFELFAQERQTIDRSQGGLGLGLAIVQSLVTLHGGSVTAHSEGLGKGSEFRITLKAGVHPTQAAEAKSTGPDLRHKILVVDDNVDAAELLAEALVLFGFDAQVAHDGPSALALAATLQPRVGLLDIGLPVMDGYELAGKLREIPGLEQVKLIAVTGYGQSSDRERSRNAGFAAHLVKPVDIQLVRTTIKSLLLS